jgi:hypothetical protein
MLVAWRPQAGSRRVEQLNVLLISPAQRGTTMATFPVQSLNNGERACETGSRQTAWRATMFVIGRREVFLEERLEAAPGHFDSFWEQMCGSP